MHITNLLTLTLTYFSTQVVYASIHSPRNSTHPSHKNPDLMNSTSVNFIVKQTDLNDLVITPAKLDVCAPLLDFTVNINQNRTKAESSVHQPTLECYTKKNSKSIATLVKEAKKNKSLMSLLRSASLSPIETTQDMKSAIYRLYESKGRGVADAYYALTSDDPQIVSKKLKYFWGGIVNKNLRNLDPSAKYGGDELRLTPQITDYAKTWLLFQQFLLNDISEGNGVATTAYRFGALNGNYEGHSLSKIPHLSSSSGDYLFWAPSYWKRAVTMETGTLNVYRIDSNYRGVDISRITDKTLNPDSRIGSNEIVFPAGSSFELTSTQTYSFGNKTIVSDIDMFNCENFCKANYVFTTSLNLIQSDSSSSPLRNMSLLYKGFQEEWEIGDDITAYFHGRQLPNFTFKDASGKEKNKKMDELKVFNIKAI